MSFGDGRDRDGLTGLLATAGERLALRCATRSTARRLLGAFTGELSPPDAGDATFSVTIEDDRRPFPLIGFTAVARGVWSRGSDAVVRNVCSSGFDLRVTFEAAGPAFAFRRRPTAASHAAAMMRARDRQLRRLTLLTYPALWVAACAGRAPLHVAAFATSDIGVLVGGPPGIGKSTVLQLEMASGARPISDNLCVSDGTRVWPVAEPLRLVGVGGQRAPRGRGEAPVPARPSEAPMHVVVVLRRGATAVRPLDAPAAARALVAGTYTAGELRRFWSFAATLAAATGTGPAHPPVVPVARALAGSLRCVEVARASVDDPTVSTLLRDAGVSTVNVSSEGALA